MVQNSRVGAIWGLDLLWLLYDSNTIQVPVDSGFNTPSTGTVRTPVLLGQTVALQPDPEADCLRRHRLITQCAVFARGHCVMLRRTDRLMG